MNQYENKPTTAMLSHESLDVYQLSLKFHLGVMTLLPHRGSPTLRDQLERASISIILNIAEGAGRRSPADRRRHFVIRESVNGGVAQAQLGVPAERMARVMNRWAANFRSRADVESYAAAVRERYAKS